MDAAMQAAPQHRSPVRNTYQKLWHSLTSSRSSIYVNTAVLDFCCYTPWSIALFIPNLVFLKYHFPLRIHFFVNLLHIFQSALSILLIPQYPIYLTCPTCPTCLIRSTFSHFLPLVLLSPPYCLFILARVVLICCNCWLLLMSVSTWESYLIQSWQSGIRKNCTLLINM